MYKSVAILLSAAGGLVAGHAHASDHQWYASGQVGVRAVEQQAITAPSVAIDLEQHNGLYASFALGRYFDRDGIGFRGELETAYRDGGRISQFSVNNASTAVSGDGLSSWSLMANGIVDFNNRSRFTPYVGAGIGVIRLDGDIQSPGNFIDDTATVFGAQGIVGVDIRLSKSVSAFTDLRYQKAFGSEMTLVGTAGSGAVDVDYDAYTVGAGIRLSF